MIRLKELLNEVSFPKENRINLMKLTALMEKLLPELTKAQAKKLTELCTEVHEMASKLNETRYTVFNWNEWNILKLGMMTKLLEVKEEASKLTKSDKIDIKPFIIALDEIIVD